MIKLFSRFILIFAFIFVVAVVGAYVLLIISGRTLLANELTTLTGKKTTVGKLVMLPPFNFQVQHIDVEDAFKIESVFLSPSILRLLTGKIAFNDVTIVKPEFTYVKFTPVEEPASPVQEGEAETAAQPVTEAPAAATQAPAAAPAPASKIEVLVKNLRIKDGVVTVIDKDVSPEGLKVTFNHVNAAIENLYFYPVSAISEFRLTAKIEGRKEVKEATLETVGWINFLKKDMKAKLTIHDIDGVYFYPYYALWDDMEKFNIENAKLNFSSDIQGVDNAVNAACRLELVEMNFKSRGPDEKQGKEEKIAHAVFDIIKSMNHNAFVLEFNIHTKINSPTINFTAIKTALEDKISLARESQAVTVENVARAPGKVIGGTVTGLTDITRAVISGGASIGKELKSAIEGAFTKEPQVKPEEFSGQAQPVDQSQQPVQEQAAQPQTAAPAQ